MARLAYANNGELKKLARVERELKLSWWRKALIWVLRCELKPPRILRIGASTPERK